MSGKLRDESKLYDSPPYILEVEDLWVKAGDNLILKGLDLRVGVGKLHVIFGPNGSGKSTLLGAIMGLPQFEVIKGDIKFRGRSILGLSTDERAKLGIGLAFQRPPLIKGVRLRALLATLNGGDAKIEELAANLDLKNHLDRELNDGFSGGEMKRSEILQLLVQRPELVLLDEPESGVDLENITLLARFIGELLERGKHIVDRKRSGIIITHTGHILSYLNADIAHVMMEGKILCHGSPMDVLHQIKAKGYKECVECLLGEQSKEEAA